MKNCAVISPRDVGLVRRGLRARIETAFDIALVWRTNIPSGGRVVAHVGWGRKASGERAQRRANADGLPCWRLEDGFLRSVGLGADELPLSLIKDDVGVYYDASAPSRLEQLIPQILSPPQGDRARRLIQAWREGRVSKYNHQRSATSALPDRFVLVADQTWGDASIRYGDASAEDFQRMLNRALEDANGCKVLLKIHPDVLAGKKRGHFDVAALKQDHRIEVLAEALHPSDLLERAERVYVVSSQMGFEALLWGKPVHTFGMPFYAGWGLTHDEKPGPARRSPAATLEQLVHAALVDYPAYVNPETGQRCEPEVVLAHLALQRRGRERHPPLVHAVAFSAWKKPIVQSFLQGSHVRFVDENEIPAEGTLVLWGRKIPSLAERTQDVLRLEDGFLRSVGLGADLIRPLSWVVDSHGIYYDAGVPSDLEILLAQTDFSPALLERAARLRSRLVKEGLTKYNVGAQTWQRPAKAQRVILVPGQVESDASIRYGAPGLRTNMDLLRAVRAAHPGAYLVYKPHPDVHAGLREKGVAEDQATDLCDERVMDVPMAGLLSEVDEVCVLTSLTGFEALLRDKPVTCYGQPFFSGWGLTRDILPHPRRQRVLTLDMLVAGALLMYPTYVSRTTGRFTTAERALDELLEWRRLPPRRPHVWRTVWRLLQQLSKSVQQ